MQTVTVNVSFPRRLLVEMDSVAKRESRTRSELLRAAARLYVEQQRRWKAITTYSRQQAKRLQLSADDVERKIAEYRREA